MSDRKDPAGAAPRVSQEDVAARVAHEANRAYCAALGDHSHLPWDQAPAWQKDSIRAGIHFHATRGPVTDRASHDCWCAHKRAAGWQWGPVKDPDRKEHPNIAPFEELPETEKMKDRLFRAVINAFIAEG